MTPSRWASTRRPPNAITTAAVRQTFEDWRVKEHPVTSADRSPANPDILQIEAGAPDRYFSWEKIGATENADVFHETDGSPDRASGISDAGDPGLDFDSVFNGRLAPRSGR